MASPFHNGKHKWKNFLDNKHNEKFKGKYNKSNGDKSNSNKSQANFDMEKKK